jgi:hypothetical protein
MPTKFVAWSEFLLYVPYLTSSTRIASITGARKKTKSHTNGVLSPKVVGLNCLRQLYDFPQL